jgi:hypothetical protein
MAFEPDAADKIFRPIAFENPDRLLDSTPAWIGHIPFAFWIIDVHRPKVLVELGTHAGVSYCAFAQAVQRLKLPTQCFAVDTWKGDENAGFYPEEVFEEFSRYHDTRFASFSRLVRSTFDRTLEHFGDGTVDLLHIDGLHTFEAVTHDFETWLPKLSPRGVVLFHDINVRENDFGVWKLWADLCDRYRHFSFHHGHGLGVLGVGKDVGPELKWLFDLSDNATQNATATFVRLFFERLGSSLVDRSQVAALRNERGEISRRSEAMERDLSGLRKERDEISRRSEAMERDLSGLRKERDEISRRSEAMERDLSELRKVIEELRAELETTRREVAAMRSVAQQLQERTLRGRIRGLFPGLYERIQAKQVEKVVAYIKNSGAFDFAWYLEKYPDVAASGMDPVLHYVRYGADEGRWPRADFDTAAYRHSQPDLAFKGENPFSHHLMNVARQHLLDRIG